MGRINIRKLEQHPSVLSYKQVTQICAPLFERFNLNFFCHARCYHDGSLTILTTAGAFLKQTIMENIAVGHNVTERFPPGFYFWETDERIFNQKAAKRSQQQIANARECFNINNGFMVVEHAATEWTDIYDFGAPRNNQSIKNFYVNNLDILQRHINYFHEKSLPLFNVVDTNRLQLYRPVNIKLRNRWKEQAVNSFIKETRSRHLYSNKTPKTLNKRELECLIFTLRGKSCTEIAQTLNVSPKTVQGYISDVKQKLDCTKRSDLFKRAIDLKLLKVATLL